jgi:hypothetical protein
MLQWCREVNHPISGHVNFFAGQTSLATSPNVHATGTGLSAASANLFDHCGRQVQYQQNKYKNPLGGTGRVYQTRARKQAQKEEEKIPD